MEYGIGIVLAIVVGLFASAVGFDRQRAFYPVVMIVIALYYALFTVMGGALQLLVPEGAVIAGFILVSVLGFKYNLWLVAGALFAHGVFDVIHGHWISNPGVPLWWPGWCLAYDVAAAGYLAWLLKSSKVQARP